MISLRKSSYFNSDTFRIIITNPIRSRMSIGYLMLTRPFFCPSYENKKNHWRTSFFMYDSSLTSFEFFTNLIISHKTTFSGIRSGQSTATHRWRTYWEIKFSHSIMFQLFYRCHAMMDLLNCVFVYIRMNWTILIHQSPKFLPVCTHSKI